MANRIFSRSRIYCWIAPMVCVLLLAACAVSGESLEEIAPSNIKIEAPPTIVITPLSARYEVVVDIANLRSGPGIEFPEVGKVSEGDIINVNGILADDNWYRLEGKEETWISAAFVSSVADPEMAETDPTQKERRDSQEAVAINTPTSTPTSRPATPTVTVTAIESTDPPTDPTKTVTPTPTPCARHLTNWVIYTVKPGDNLLDLSRLVDFSVEGIMYANCMENTRLAVGQALSLPRLSVTLTPTNTPTPTPSATPTTVLRAPVSPVRIDTPSPTATVPRGGTPSPTLTATPIRRDTLVPTATSIPFIVITLPARPILPTILPPIPRLPSIIVTPVDAPSQGATRAPLQITVLPVRP